MPGFPHQRSREMDPPFEMKKEIQGSYEFWRDPLVPLEYRRVVRNFLSFLKGVKDPFVAQEGWLYFSRAAAAIKGLSLR